MRLAATGLVALVALLAAGCGGDDEGDLASFCAALADGERFERVFDRLDPTDPDGARTAFERAREEQEALRDLAPEAARGDVEIVLAFVDDLIDGLRPGASRDDLGRPSIYQSLRPRFDEVEAAGDRLQVYVESNC